MNESKDDILDLAIEYAVRGCYKDGLSKDKKRAVRKRAKNLIQPNRQRSVHPVNFHHAEYTDTRILGNFYLWILST